MLKEELEDRHIAGNWWIWLIAILGMAVATRLYFLPYDLPPVMDGVDYFAYSLEIRNLGDVKWLATEDKSPGKGTGRHIACFILKGKKK